MIGSVKGQAAFNHIKGSTPARINDIDESLLDPIELQQVTDMKNAKYRIPVPQWLAGVPCDFDAFGLYVNPAYEDGGVNPYYLDLTQLKQGIQYEYATGGQCPVP
jgi:hypothetical protein